MPGSAGLVSIGTYVIAFASAKRDSRYQSTRALKNRRMASHTTPPIAATISRTGTTKSHPIEPLTTMALAIVPKMPRNITAKIPPTTSRTTI